MIYHYKISFYILVVSVSFVMGQENPHGNLQLPCNTCHTTTGWDSILFDHSQTRFELNGTHKYLECATCHVVENFSDIDGDCVSCHTDFHKGRLTPECKNCHTEQSWSIFNPVKAHRNTSFQLLGKHANLDCGSCHFSEIEGEFLRLDTDCFKCHLQNFQNTTSPVHTSLGFGLRCEDCHSFFSWRPALFNEHDSVFPIFSGQHRGTWDECSDCHLVPNNYSSFSCSPCHGKSNMDSEHDDIQGYVYESQACLSCHPNGGE
jgi:hypothetical protein